MYNTAVISGAEGLLQASCSLPTKKHLTCHLPSREPEKDGVVKRGEAGIMGTSIFTCLFIILLAGCSPGGCADERVSSSHSKRANSGMPVCAWGNFFELLFVYPVCNPDLSCPDMTGSTKAPVLLNNTADITAFISAAEVAVVGFFQDLESPEVSEFRQAADAVPEVPFGLSTSPSACSQYNTTAGTVVLFRTGILRERTAVTVGVFVYLQIDGDRRDLPNTDGEEIQAETMIRFVRINELRLVTEYNPVTAVGLMQSSIQLHLLLITDKKSSEHPEHMHRFREAAELFRRKILFVLVDCNVKGNERVMSFFKLKKSQLPALAIFHSEDEEQDVLLLDEVSVERVQEFCNVFLERKQKVRGTPAQSTGS
ncbi:endoplasmic reticulum resident protein 27 [Eudromia elegans]